jgi:hypothetical protein
MDLDGPALPPSLGRVVRRLSEAFDARQVRYTLVGGMAAMLQGRPRLTQDVVILLDVPQIVLPGLLDDLIARGFILDPLVVIRQYVREHITAFYHGDIRVDWLKPVLPLYVRTLADAEPLNLGDGHTIRVATAEGLVLTKMVAFRLRDRLDIEDLLTANRDDIDLALIREEWSPYAEGEPERTAWLEEVITRKVHHRE